MKRWLLILLFLGESKSEYISLGTCKISENAKRYVNDVLNNNRLSYGPYLKRLEKEFANLHGARFGLMSNSGTSSLHVALQALKICEGWEDGDEVIVPAVTFVATANIVLHNGMKPVFVDVDKDFYEIDPALIESKITPKTRALIPVHLFGQPCDMDPICSLAKKYNLKIIEDSCETMFAHYKGKPVGSMGDIGCFSTYVAHLLITGVGGFSITNNSRYGVCMRSLLNHGRDSIYISIDDDKNVSEESKEVIIERRFKFLNVGHSFRVTELEGALGIAQLEDWEYIINTRRENAQYLIDNLQHLQDVLQLPQIRKGNEHSFMMFPLVLKNGDKKRVINFLEKHGIETRDMLPLINQPVYLKRFGLKGKDYPVADWINNNGFYIGCHQELSKSHLDYIVPSIR